MKKVILIGGALVVAYLIFKPKGPKPKDQPQAEDAGGGGGGSSSSGGGGGKGPSTTGGSNPPAGGGKGSSTQVVPGGESVTSSYIPRTAMPAKQPTTTTASRPRSTFSVAGLPSVW